MSQQSNRRLAQLAREWSEAHARHPWLVAGLTASALIVAVLSLVVGVWFLTGLRQGLPEYDALSRIGDMDQSTAVFDRNDQLAFTIYREQRMDVSLEEISPNLVKAIVAIEDQRFY